jgi:hypothetical protein
MPDRPFNLAVMRVIKRFIDKDTKKVYQPGDNYSGSPERISALISKQLLAASEDEPEKKVVNKTKPEKVNVLFSKHKSKSGYGKR